MTTRAATDGILLHAKASKLPPFTHANEDECLDIYQPYVMRCFGAYSSNGVIVSVKQALSKGINVRYINDYTIIGETQVSTESVSYTPVSVANKINRKMPPRHRVDPTTITRAALAVAG